MASLIIEEKKEFVILTPAKAIAFVPFEDPARTKFVIEIAATRGMTQFRRCYTPKELTFGGKKKDQGKRPISKGE